MCLHTHTQNTRKTFYHANAETSNVACPPGLETSTRCLLTFEASAPPCLQQHMCGQASLELMHLVQFAWERRGQGISHCSFSCTWCCQHAQWCHVEYTIRRGTSIAGPLEHECARSWTHCTSMPEVSAAVAYFQCFAYILNEYSAWHPCSRAPVVAQVHTRPAGCTSLQRSSLCSQLPSCLCHSGCGSR